jgi:hypothetical protein
MSFSGLTTRSPGAGSIGDPVDRFVMSSVLYSIADQSHHKGNKYPEVKGKGNEYNVRSV